VGIYTFIMAFTYNNARRVMRFKKLCRAPHTPNDLREFCLNHWIWYIRAHPIIQFKLVYGLDKNFALPFLSSSFYLNCARCFFDAAVSKMHTRPSLFEAKTRFRTHLMLFWGWSILFSAGISFPGCKLPGPPLKALNFDLWKTPLTEKCTFL